ncbi:uncharacterized protein BJ212DRAFT_1477364 [Suillus subaureus]|uniref:Uncharacterized protein n=1 Tax=Suillus subaureus TaxID=48587 RepID=A0A9P7EIU5_9AGAM|nr:uncharacterized protein BJ212DRAFT_1477364 [Suillus subaureus]KAG1822961.1 hypothetical protein BJ212DRAFT_1477364 [Suillus subaureus]
MNFDKDSYHYSPTSFPVKKKARTKSTSKLPRTLTSSITWEETPSKHPVKHEYPFRISLPTQNAKLSSSMPIMRQCILPELLPQSTHQDHFPSVWCKEVLRYIVEGDPEIQYLEFPEICPEEYKVILKLIEEIDFQHHPKPRSEYLVISEEQAEQHYLHARLTYLLHNSLLTVEMPSTIHEGSFDYMCYGLG